MPLATDSILIPGQIIADRYVVLRAYPLTESGYYDVADLKCGRCGQRNQPTSTGFCQSCQAPLPPYLLRETAASQSSLKQEELIRLSQSSPFILPHLKIGPHGHRAYILLPHLAQWRSLAKVKIPVSPGQIVAWSRDFAGALAALSAGHFYLDLTPSLIEKFIIEGETIRLADLLACRRIKSVNADHPSDIWLLAGFIYYLLTGQHLSRPANPQKLVGLPQPLRVVLERVMNRSYSSPDEVLEDLGRNRSPDDYGLSLKPASGKASDPGKTRQNNEDTLYVLEVTRVQESRGVPLGLYLVADGMGGHQAGEIASRTVSKIITERVLNAEVIPGLKFTTRRLDATPESVLRSAIQEANHALYTQARAKGNNMGTTLTVALVIGDTVTIANVGDSRTYLLRGEKLEQVTADHSLVASLVAAGVIQPEEVRSHPQRNVILRNLGDKPEVEVDIFSRTLERGDQLILCSDGLWEMISDEEIKRGVRTLGGPQAASQALIDAANRAGGEDNVTAIVVKME
jgi:protein phosphatase